MAKELAFVLINPYTIAKSRTGGVIARFIARTGLDLVAARMFGPSAELAAKYAELVRHADPANRELCELIAEYIKRQYAPSPETGRPRRVMMLLFAGEDAVARVWTVTGSATLRTGSGQTIRDTYGDYVLDEQKRVKYFEPAVLVAPSLRRAAATLNLWARYAQRDGGLVQTAADVARGGNVERTLVLLKPDNFRQPSARAGSIIDILSNSGMRIVAVKKLAMTVAQAEAFYAPVRMVLREKFPAIGGRRVAEALQKELGFAVPPAALKAICEQLAGPFAEAQFEEITEFMTGFRPSQCRPAQKAVLGDVGCLALVYEGEGAVRKIRDILGATNPTEARPGSVRREFGSSIMVNAAHASDSPENARREIGIVNVEEDTIRPWVDFYYGGVLARLRAAKQFLPQSGRRWMRRLRAPQAATP